MMRWILAILLPLSGPTISAQDFPSRPIRLIVPFPPGGSTDNYARLLARELTSAWNQTVVVDNRPGATGIIGTQTVRQATPDGYTLLFTSNTGHVLGPLLRSTPPFDSIKDFTPISIAVRFPLYLIIHPSIPARTLAEFITYAKANDGKLNYASSGEGGYSHVAALLFNAATGIKATHIPYKGAAPAQLAVVAGEAQYRFDNIGTSHPLVIAGKLRGLAITGKSRSPAVPDVPTAAEAGVRGLEGVLTWLGMLGPAGLPDALVNRINTEVVRIMRSPEVVKRVARDGYELAANTPAQFRAEMLQEQSVLVKVIEEQGLKIQ
ncbi:MAG: tripartite tricarboxylate transporter substrate binding protein [Betaproteobacteria bacterium]|nr:tripartite tricarboxylate transporter substrate binding protein [Betaproteobacteria bacterium]